MTESVSRSRRASASGTLPGARAVLFALTLLFGAACASNDQAHEQAVLAGQRVMEMQAELQPTPDYLLQPGDTLTIKFFYTPDLDQKTLIRPDGKISLQLIGEIQAADHTPAQLHDALVERYAGTLKNPEIAVIIDAINSQKFFVGGEVYKPGLLEQSPGMTTMQGIIAAGGHKTTAELRNVVIVRYQGTNEPLILLVDLEQGLSSLKGYNDIILRPRDIVFVPMSRIATVNQFVDQYIDKVLPFSRQLSLQYTKGSVSVAN